MSQVIIYKNPDATNVVVCYPTGELPIEEVLVKDCPAGAIIVEDSVLPQGADEQFFNAWELNGSTITVNLAKAKEQKLFEFNGEALMQAQKRQANTLAGIDNDISDEDFLSSLKANREAIANAASTTELALIKL